MLGNLCCAYLCWANVLSIRNPVWIYYEGLNPKSGILYKVGLEKSLFIFKNINESVKYILKIYHKMYLWAFVRVEHRCLQFCNTYNVELLNNSVLNIWSLFLPWFLYFTSHHYLNFVWKIMGILHILTSLNNYQIRYFA